MKIPLRVAFQTPGFRHSPNMRNTNITYDWQLAIDEIHPSHFNDEDDPLNEWRYLDAIKNMTDQISTLSRIEDEKYVTSKSKGYIVTTVAYLSALYACFVVIIKYYHKYRKVQTRSSEGTGNSTIGPEYNPLSTQPSTTTNLADLFQSLRTNTRAASSSDLVYAGNLPRVNP